MSAYTPPCACVYFFCACVTINIMGSALLVRKSMLGWQISAWLYLLYFMDSRQTLFKLPKAAPKSKNNMVPHRCTVWRKYPAYCFWEFILKFWILPNQAYQPAMLHRWEACCFVGDCFCFWCGKCCSEAWQALSEHRCYSGLLNSLSGCLRFLLLRRPPRTLTDVGIYAALCLCLFVLCLCHN